MLHYQLHRWDLCDEARFKARHNLRIQDHCMQGFDLDCTSLEAQRLALPSQFEVMLFTTTPFRELHPRTLDTLSASFPPKTTSSSAALGGSPSTRTPLPWPRPSLAPGLRSSTAPPFRVQRRPEPPRIVGWQQPPPPLSARWVAGATALACLAQWRGRRGRRWERRSAACLCGGRSRNGSGAARLQGLRSYVVG